MVSEKGIARFMFLRVARMTPKKVSTRPQKNYASEFLILPALKLPSCQLLAFIDMNTYIITESRNFKTFLKKKYATALDMQLL